MRHRTKRMPYEEERLNAYQNICAVITIAGIMLFAGAGNELTAIIAIILIAIGAIGISKCDKKLKKLEKGRGNNEKTGH